MYNLTNTGRGIRVVHDRHHKEVIVGPGETKYMVDMLPAHADELTNRKDQVAVTPGTPDPNTPAPPVEQVSKRPARIKLEQESPNQVAERAKKAAAHLDKAEAMEFNDWRDEAKAVLGDKWPGGSPKKATVVELLQDAAKEA